MYWAGNDHKDNPLPFCVAKASDIFNLLEWIFGESVATHSIITWTIASNFRFIETTKYLSGKVQRIKLGFK